MKPRSWLRRLIQGAALCVVLWLAGSLIVAYALTRRPRSLQPEPAPLVPWGTLEELRLATRDGEELGAWLSRGPADGPSVLILHGHRGCRRNSLRAAEFFAEQGASLLLPSLRAHGDSTGSFVDFGYSARHDVIAAVEELERQRPGRPIVVVGVSMGAAAALYAAPELGDRVAGYILESPYRDVRQATRNRTEMLFPFPADRVAFAGLDLVAPLMLPDIDRLAPIDHVTDIPAGTPVLFLSGDQDRHAPSVQVQALADRRGGTARHIVVAGAGHGSLLRDNREQYEATVQPWLREVVGLPGE